MPSASYQCKLAASLGRYLSPACHSLVRLPRCSRLCAHPSAAAHPPLSALELSLSRLLTRPLATLYLPLSHLHLSPQSPSLNARSRLNMPCFNITSASSGRKHRGHSLPDLFSPSHLPLGYCSMYGIDRIGTHLYERRCLQCGGKRLQPDRPGPFPRYPALV